MTTRGDGVSHVDQPAPDAWLAMPSGVRLRGAELSYRELEDLRTLSHDELLALEFTPQPWIVPGLLPAGLALLVSAPKLGKTWLAMQLVHALAAGGKWLHWELPPGIGSRCWWMENDHQSLQERFLRIQAQQPAGLPIVHTVGAFEGNSLAERLAVIRADIEDRIASGFPLRLVVVDTLQLLQGLGRSNDNAYRADVMALAELRKIALQHRICILALHHTNKSADDNDDPLMNVNGSNGIIGTANTVMIIQRPRGGNTGVLHVTGHQVGDQKIPMRFEHPLWTFDPDLDPDLAVTVGIENRVLGAVKAGADTFDQLAAALPALKRQQITDALRELRGKSLVTTNDAGHTYPVRSWTSGAVATTQSDAEGRATSSASDSAPDTQTAADPVAAPAPATRVGADVSRETTVRPAPATEPYKRPDWAPDDLTKGRVRTFNLLVERAAVRMNTPLIMHPYRDDDDLPPPYRLVGKGLGTLVHEGGHDWKSPTVDPGQLVTPLDKNAAYLAALGAAILPIGRCELYPGRGPADQVGIHRLDQWPEWNRDWLPHPGGSTPRGRRAKEIWIGSETLKLWQQDNVRDGLGEYVVLTSFTSPPLREGHKPTVSLERVYIALRDARSAAIAAGDEEFVAFLKSVWSIGVSTMGESTSNTRIWRPDFPVAIRSTANANLWRAGYRAALAGIPVARMYGTDELHLAGNPWVDNSPFTMGLALNEWKVKGAPYAWR